MNHIASYIAAGFVLIPIPLGTKGPITKGWNKRENVITTQAAAAALTENIGLAHAYCSPPTCALDIDNLALAIAHFHNKSVDLAALLDAADAVRIESGRQYRAKLIYRLPSACNALQTVQYADPDSKAMVFEFRCAAKNGTTVQDVLPPSVHPDTNQPYQWAGTGHFSKLPLIPDPLLTIWKELISGGERRKRNNHGQALEKLPGIPLQKSAALDAVTRAILCQPETPSRIAEVNELLSNISADCSYDVYRDIVWAVADTGWDCAYDLLRAWSLTAPHRFEEETLDAIFHSFTYAGGIHYGTLIHHARMGGWNV